MELNKVYLGDALDVLKTFPDESVDCCVTSPPYYGLRDYGVDGQIGLEDTPTQYIEKLVSLFREIRRALKKDGTLWVNLGDSYNSSAPGIKPKDLIGIPWMFAFALRTDGWFLRQDIIWAKPNSIPESVSDRCTKSHEYIFLFSKSEKYYFDNEAIMEIAEGQEHPQVNKLKTRTHEQGYAKAGGHRDNNGGLATKTIIKDGAVMRNKRDVWIVCVKPNKEAHFATYPEELIVPCILAGSRENGVVLDPFMGSGTTGIVARKLNRNFVGIELNPEYRQMAERRIFNEGENIFNQ